MKNLKTLFLTMAIGMIFHSQAQDMLNINDLNYGKESVNSAYIVSDSAELKITTIVAAASAVEKFNKFHFLVHGNIAKHGLGFGVKVNTAFYQLFQLNTTEFMLAKRVSMGKSHSLNFGINSGLVMFNLRTDKINQYTDINDPVILNEQYNRLGFTTGFGLRYNWKDKIDLGVSMPVVVQSNNGFAPIYNTSLSYKQKVGDTWSFAPGIMIYGTDYTGPTIEGSVILDYKDLVWVKLAGRSTKNISGGLGVKLNFIELGYTYNAIVGEGFNETFNNLHAIKASFMFIGANSLRKNNNNQVEN